MKMKKGPTKRERQQERDRIVRDNWHRATINIMKLKVAQDPTISVKKLAEFIGLTYSTTTRIIKQYKIKVVSLYDIKKDKLLIYTQGRILLGNARLVRAGFKVGQLIRIKIEPGKITLESELESNQNSEVEKNDNRVLTAHVHPVIVCYGLDSASTGIKSILGILP